MITFKQHLEQQQIVEAVQQVIILQEAEPMLTEGLLEEGKLESLLHKSGLHLGKSTGLIQYVAAAGKGIAQMVTAAVRGDKEGVKAVAKKVKKEDVLDFLLKLDQATLHLITGPIHMIDSITGWHLWAAVKKGVEKVPEIIIKVKQAIQTVKQHISALIDQRKATRYEKVLNRLETELA